MEQSENEDVEGERRITAESGKVGFEEGNSRSSDQKRKSSIGFKENLDDRGKSEDASENRRLDSGKSEILAKKNSSILRPTSTNTSGRPSNRLSEVGQYDIATIKEIESRRKTLFASQRDLSHEPSLFTKLSDLPERSKENIGFTHRDVRSNKIWSPSTPTTDLSGKSSSRFKLSDNVPVKSMALDLPRSANLLDEEADAYAGILEYALNELELIRYRIPAEVDPNWDEGYKTPNEKYDVPEEPKYSLRQYLGLPSVVLGVFEELQKDRTYIHNILKDLTEDLRINRRYDRLDVEIDKIAKTIEDEHSLEINHEIWTEQVDQLTSLIKSEKIDNEIEAKRRISEVHESAADIDDAIFQSNSKLEYVKGWEEARLGGQRLRIELEEQKLQEELSEIERGEKIEEIVSEEIRAFLQQETERLQEEYQNWTTRFNDEVDDFDLEIEYLKRDIKIGEMILEKNSIVFTERQEFIDECVERRRKIAEERAYWDGLNKAATRIQALWRGYMVRKQIGPFRGLWKRLKSRKKMAAKKRKKMEAKRKKLEEKKAAEAKKTKK